MGNSPAKPGITELYRLGEQLQRDRSAALPALRERDHAIGARCEASTDSGRLLFWLREVRLPAAGGARGREHWLSEPLVANILRGAALFLGFSAMATFLLASGRGLVNVFLFLLLFVLLPLTDFQAGEFPIEIISNTYK